MRSIAQKVGRPALLTLLAGSLAVGSVAYAQTPDDASALASPVPKPAAAESIAIGSVVRIRMVDTVSSGANVNGDTVHAVLTAPLKTSKGTVIPAGTGVAATVVSSAKAGVMQSAGVLSLQLTRIGVVAVISDVLDFTGKEGKREVPDAAPAKGTEAVIQPNTTLTFHVMENGKATGLDKKDAAKRPPPD